MLNKIECVSIPFKREGTVRLRPPTGSGNTERRVSIPFKREGTVRHTNQLLEVVD